MTAEVKKEEIGYACNIITDLGNGRQLSMTFNLLKGVSVQEMNSDIDKMVAVGNRQQAKSALIAATQEVEKCQMRLETAVEDFKRIEEKETAKNGLSANERQAKEQAVASIDKLRKDLEYKLTVIEQLKEEAK